MIVRYGRLYILYGHFAWVDPEIYVGKVIEAGDRLGRIGTYTDSNTHLHMEVRRFSESSIEDLPSDITAGNVALEQIPSANGSTGNNPYGILYYNEPIPPPNVYDIALLFQETGVLNREGGGTVDEMGLTLGDRQNRLIEDTSPGFTRLQLRASDELEDDDRLNLAGICRLNYFTIPTVPQCQSGYTGFDQANTSVAGFSRPVEPLSNSSSICEREE